MGLADMSRMSSNEADFKEGMQQIALCQDVKNQFLAIRLDVLYMLTIKDVAEIEGKAKDIALLTESIHQKIASMEGMGFSAQERTQLQAFREGVESYVAKAAKLAAMSKEARTSGSEAALQEAVNFAVTSLAPMYVKPAEIIATLVTENMKTAEQTYQLDLAMFHRSRLLMVAGIGIVVTLSVLIGILTAISISRPLQTVIETLRKVADGDLTARLHLTSQDEMGILAREVNATAGKLSRMIDTVSNTSQQVAAAAIQLHATSTSISTGAEEMAAQAGTVATASEEMSATSGDIARSCHNAASSALHASETAQAGAGVVENTVQVMGRIASRVMSTAQTVENLGARGDQIGAIIGTIEDIADQTNLLALNAAIEAARAGEQERGFAVVADEVRALAERTTKSTREIGEMIKAIQHETRGAVTAMEEGVREVENGTAEAARSGEALQAILEQISAVNIQVSQIATAAEEQTATTSEITSNILQINDVVHQSASGATESALAANQLSRLAEELQQVVGQFRV